MKEKRKSTPKAKVLTAVLLVLFLGSCVVLIYAVFTDVLGLNPSTASTEPSSTVAVTESTALTETAAITTEVATTASEAAETTTLDSSLTLGTTYNADYWVEHKAEYGTPGLAVLFGAKTQGVFVSFDGSSFAVNVVNGNESYETETGTFSFNEDGNIELSFDNSDISRVAVVESENGVITSMDFPLAITDTTLRLSLAD